MKVVTEVNGGGGGGASRPCLPPQAMPGSSSVDDAGFHFKA